MEERWQAAIESYERVLSLDSSDPKSHLEMAIAYLHANQPHKAAARLSFVLAHFSADPAVKAQLGEIHFRLGEATEATGNIGGALVEYLKASSMEPTNAAYSQKVSNISGR
jgi:tetratricopeptide (TPR) repeat protein